jgi:hypothetical protein
MRQRPAYCVHKSKNLAYVRIRGRMIYLGRAHSRESLARYSEIVAAVLAGEEPPRGRITPIAAALNVGELAERWTLAMREQRLLRHAELAADLRDRLARRLLCQGVGNLLFRETLLLHANLQDAWRPKCPR